MVEGKRQKQIAAVLTQELNDIFQRLGLAMIYGGMVSISSVKLTPDLHEARIYLSFYLVNDKKAALQLVQDRAWEIKKEVVSRMGKQLRVMPVLHFYEDDSLDYVDKIENIFKEIKKNGASS